MASSNGDSDIRPDRIQAREDQFCRDIRARRQSPAAKNSIDLTELSYMGAHLDLPKHEPWPHSLELLDSEAMPSSSVSTLVSLNTNTHPRPDPGSSVADGSPASRACTPTKCVSYLPPHEYEEFQRQVSVNNAEYLYQPPLSQKYKRNITQTAVSNGRLEPLYSYSVSHTPSHCSRALTDRDDRSVKNVGPISPGPWSQFGQSIRKHGMGGD